MKLYKRQYLVLLIALFTAIGLSACGGSGSDSSPSDTAADTSSEVTAGGTLEFAQATDVTGFDQSLMADNESIRVISQITEPLYRTDADGSLIPWLATDYERSDDGKTWTFQIREGVEFSNGDPMTEEDVVFTLKRALESETWGFLFTNVADVSSPGPMQVAVKTKQPSASLLASIATFVNGVVPKDLAGMSDEEWAQNPIGTGPFVLDSWTRGQTVTLKRNPNYWVEDRPILDEVRINAIPDDNSRVAQLRGGQQNLIAFPPYAQLDSIKNTEGLTLADFVLSKVTQLYVNIDEAPFTNEKVREAISLSLDREAIVSGSLFGVGEAARGLIPPSITPMDDLQGPKEDPEAAAAIVEGLSPAERKFSIYLTSGDSIALSVGQILQQSMETAGFEVTLEPIDMSALTQKWQTSDFGALLTATSSDIVDPSELVGFYYGNNGIFTNAPTEQVKKLATQADAEDDAEERAAIYNEIQTLINDENALISLVVEPYAYALQDSVQGFAVNPTGIYWLADVSVSGS